MNISLIYAVSENGVIGKDGGLPWHVPSDLQHFKAVTLGKPIIMGRKTWESLPRKPLTGRKNIVITRQTGLVAEGALVVANVEQALSLCGQDEEICVIGGAEVFKLFWAVANKIYLTKILGVVEGDIFMPAISTDEWVEVSRSPIQKTERDSHGFEVIAYVRRNL